MPSDGDEHDCHTVGLPYPSRFEVLMGNIIEEQAPDVREP